MAKYDSGWTIEELATQCRWLEEKIEYLEAENKRLREDCEHYRFRVDNELEPMIKAKEKVYDNYVTDPERHGGGSNEY